MAAKNYLKPRPGKNINNFARVVAEQDPELQDYYVDSDRYVSRALDFTDPAVFFVGPKGAGKSAILQMVRLVRAADSHRVISISPDDLAFSALANVKASTPILSEVSKHQWLFKSLWDYILALEILKREYKDKTLFRSYLERLLEPFFGPQRDAEARRLLLVSLGDEGQSMSLSSRILQLVNEVELSADVPQTAKVAGKAKLDQAKAGQGGQLWLLSLINGVAKKIGETVSSPYHVLIDDLDLHWHDTPVQNAFIAALFHSLRNFSKPPNLKCAVAIRDHIFRRLPLADRDKYHDWVCHVEWQEPNLKKMIEKRVTAKLEILAKDVWGGLFPANAFGKMVKHSYGRPREAIRLASTCIAEAQRKDHLHVDETDLDIGILKFSDYRITEIAAEFEHMYTGLDHIIRKFTKWEKEFTVESLRAITEDIWLEVEYREEAAREYMWAGGYVDNVRGFARILLECGILLYKSDRKAHPVVYDLDKMPEVNDGTWLAMHPAFAPALGMEAIAK